MCRNIRPLFNYDPPVGPEDVEAAARQFVRKISGFAKPSKTNQEAFDAAVKEITGASVRLLAGFVTSAPPRSRELELERARDSRRF